MENEFIGKHLLIGITFLDEQGNLIEQYQTHGEITHIDDRQGIVIEKSDGTGVYSLPPDIDSLHVAAPGEYRLRSTGEVVVNPDFVTSWTMNAKSKMSVEGHKVSGFTNFSGKPSVVDG